MNLYLGFEFAPIEGWETVMPAPTAPSNYKDEAKKAAYVAKEIEKLRNGKAAIDPLCGAVRKAVVLGAKGKDKKVDVLYETDPRDPAASLLAFLAQHVGDRMQKGNVSYFGHKIHRAARLVAIEMMAKGTLTFADHWLVELNDTFRYNRFPGFIDPVSVIFGSSDTDTDAACRRLGLTYEPGARALVSAQFAYDLAMKLGF